MKIRMKGNSIRLRLSKTDLRTLEENLIVEEQTNFGSNALKYQLIPSSNHENLDAEFNNAIIQIFIPETFSKIWNNNEIVSLVSQKELGNDEPLHILVEKDFQCLDKTTEDQTDFFINPNTSCK